VRVNNINDHLINLKNKIAHNSNKLWHVSNNIQYESVVTNSCYDMKKYTHNIYANIVPIIDPTNTNKVEPIRCSIINMTISPYQHQILQNWYDASLQMYNVVIKFLREKIKLNKLKVIKNLIAEKYKTKRSIATTSKELTGFKKKQTKSINKLLELQKSFKLKNRLNKINTISAELSILKETIKNTNINLAKLNSNYIHIGSLIGRLEEPYEKLLDYQYLRTYVFKDIRDSIIKQSGIGKDNTKIKAHMIDAVIKRACSNFKSCKTNYLRNNINKFRMRCWRHNRENRVLEIEPSFIPDNQICNKTLGKIKYYYNNKPYILNPTKAVTIHYNNKLNKYQLLVPDEVIKETTKSTKYIAIDQGIRKFASCSTNNEIIQIGSDIAKTIESYLVRIDKINGNNNINKESKLIKERKYNRIIGNLVDEMQWKVIKYMTNNYGYVIIGDLNMQKCVNKKTSNLSQMNKRVGLLMKHSKFRQRLLYKCAMNGIKYVMINEKYTSKLCSKCGEYNDIKSSEIYKCKTCKMTKDRDTNSSTTFVLMTI
jgi:IS605 OrfB family transposase